MNACQPPKPAYPASSLSPSQRGGLPTIFRAITRWIGSLAHSSCACHEVWRATAMLPRQPYSRSGAWYTTPHPGHRGAGWLAFPARYARVARYGVRQPCCRARRTPDPARGTLLIRLVAGGRECSSRLWSLSVVNEITSTHAQKTRS